MHSDARWSSDLPSSPDAQPSLLLVDYDTDAAHTLSSILRQEHYAVEIASRVDEATKKISLCSFDVVLIDLAMAEDDGLELLTEIRQTSPATCCIVLTSYATLESAVAALRCGAYDYIVKPCVIEDLKQTIGQAVEQRRLRLLATEREEQLRELNDRLEERVQARTAELLQANQRLAEAHAIKDRFLATLSHELRTPLTPLRSGIDLLRTRLAEQEWKPVLDAMQRNLEQETRLINDLLDIARISAGKLSLEKRAIHVEECLRNAVEMIEPRAFLKQQKLILDLRNVFPTLLADPIRLQQVVANLLDNAVKFSPVGSHITLTAWQADGQVMLTVVDAGPGIDPAHLDRVFEPFWQSDLSSRRQYGGTGLGLAIAREIALLHEGELQASNVENDSGACFTFRFPIVPADITPSSTQAVQSPPALRILLVDDSQDTIQVLSWLLSSKGLRIREACNVPQALEQARTEPPDVIITDIGMPGQDGYDLLRLLRADPRLRSIPVIAATGYVGSREQEQMTEAGFAAALSKPFDLSELLNILHRVCPPTAPRTSGT